MYLSEKQLATLPVIKSRLCLQITVMVEETVNSSNKPKVKASDRPRYVYSWNVTDVQKWFRRHCSDYFALYSDTFLKHDITGRTLIRINDNSLLRLGITDKKHRDDIWREILKLRLKTDILEIIDLEKHNTNNLYYEYSIA